MRRARGTRAAAALLAGAVALAAYTGDGDGSPGRSTGGRDMRIGLAYDTGGRGDKSFNDWAFAGVQAAVTAHGGTYSERAPGSGTSDRADLLVQLADAGADPVIAVGSAYSAVIGAVAERYPRVTFAQVDGPTADLTTDAVPANFTGLTFAANEGSFLGGVAAALKSETGRIGFIGGAGGPLAQEFQAGYVAGAKAARPDITVDVAHLPPAGDPDGSGDPAEGRIVAQGMYDRGADIVYAAAGRSGIGVFQAAAAARKRAIGVGSDQYQTVGAPALQSVIMTSVVKRVDNAVAAFVDDYVAGRVPGGTDIVNDLSTDGVGLATSGGFIADIANQVDGYERKIVAGLIKVPTTP